jgi:bla regulator protein BlaR1
MNSWMMGLAPYVDAIGWSLLHFLWQGALIALAYAVLRPFFTGSVARYRLGMLCLFGMLACPVATLILAWPGSVDDTMLRVASMDVSALPMQTVAASGSVLLDIHGLEAWLPGFVVVWLAGVCLLALRAFLRWRRFAALVRRAEPLSREWQSKLIELGQRLGVLRPLRLLSSIDVATPMLLGWFKPVILLPASLLSGFPPEQIEFILAHELAHVRRFDYIANLFQVAIETLLFYHPAVHWISADVRQQREQCCDDLALKLGGGSGIAYARTLADLEEWLQVQEGFHSAAPALGADGGALLVRVQRLVEPDPVRRESALRDNGFVLPLLLAGMGLLIGWLNMHRAETGAALLRVSQAGAEMLAQAAFHVRIDPFVSVAPGKLEMPAIRIAEEHAVEPSVSTPLVKTTVSPEVAALRIAQLPLHVDAPSPIAAQPIHMDVPAPVAVAVPEAAPVPTAPIPQALRVVQPGYPAEALRNGTTGRVDLDFRIAADGSVHDIRVIKAQPAGVFDLAATTALRQWRFAAGGAGATRYTRSFAFALDNGAADGCHEVTGSHICRRVGVEDLQN